MERDVEILGAGIRDLERHGALCESVALAEDWFGFDGVAEPAHRVAHVFGEHVLVVDAVQHQVGDARAVRGHGD